jgi:hypothetical protein
LQRRIERTFLHLKHVSVVCWIELAISKPCSSPLRASVFRMRR